MKKALCLAWLSCLFFAVYAQDAIEVTDQTLKISGEESLYYGFTTGDEVIFSMEELNGKELKEVEVILYPDKIIYSNLKTARLDKTIQVQTQGVYQFRFKGNRTCRVRIQRRPSRQKPLFNTSVEWVEKIDTIYKVSTKNVVIDAQERVVYKTERVIASVDTLVESILKRTERVHSSASFSGNTASINFDIPATVYDPNPIKPYKVTEVISWAYAISTGESGGAWYKDANTRALANKATQALVNTGVVSGGYGALALLAVEGINLFTSSPSQGENVKFEFLKVNDAGGFAITTGNSVAASGKITQHKEGQYQLTLNNDNYVESIDVGVEIIMVRIVTTYKNETIVESNPEAIKEKQVVKEIKDLQRVKVPVIVGARQ